MWQESSKQSRMMSAGECLANADPRSGHGEEGPELKVADSRQRM